jgi:hypothetical protein
VERLGRERAEALRTRRWNIREDNGDLYVCRGEHEKPLGCEERRFVPAAHERMKDAALEALQAALGIERLGREEAERELDIANTIIHEQERQPGVIEALQVTLGKDRDALVAAEAERDRLREALETAVRDLGSLAERFATPMRMFSRFGEEDDPPRAAANRARDETGKEAAKSLAPIRKALRTALAPDTAKEGREP